MSTTKKYWNSLQHLNEDEQFVEQAHKEFSEHIPVDEFLGKTELKETSTSRRDFLKFLGFSVTAATISACETPVTKSIPYVVKPEEVTPGIANYYATTYADGNDYCSILVKTREGRPIHIEGNKLSGVTKGGVNARVNSSVLSLYDGKRLQAPLMGDKEISWEQLDQEVSGKLNAIAASGGNIRILTNSIISPTTQELIKEFANKYNSMTEGEGENSTVKHVTYDALSYAGMIQANANSFSKATIPDYRFEKAKTIVSIGADFLNDWLSSIEYSVNYAKNRKPDGAWMSKHYQFETGMSVAGSNADVRVAIKPSEHGAVAVALYNAVAKAVGQPSVKGGNIAEDGQNIQEKINDAAKQLIATKGESLVISGSNDRYIQVVVNSINTLLENYGRNKTINIDANVLLKQSTDTDVQELVAEMNAGKVDAVIIHGVDPVYSMPASWNFAGALSKVKTKISLAPKANATSVACDYVAPTHHYLESWNDANPKAGHYSLAQPVINPLFNTRQAETSLLVWAGLGTDYSDYLKGTWEKYGYPQQTKFSNFTAYWNQALHDGVDEGEATVHNSNDDNGHTLVDLNEAAAKATAKKGGAWELELYVKTGVGEGNQDINPWLMELPDPITKVVWDNYITMNPVDMEEAGYNTYISQQGEASVAVVKAGDQQIELPVFPVPGQKRKTVGIALGYGKASIEDRLIGQNAFPLVEVENGTLSYANYNVTVTKVEGKEFPLASSQTHHTMMGRKIVNETSMAVYKAGDKNVYNKRIELPNSYGQIEAAKDIDLWDEHGISTFGHRWGMSIDLNTCTGCSACVTACTSENNVPIVGKDEVKRNRTMYWLRIDRYFTSDTKKNEETEDELGTKTMYQKMETPSAYPEVVHQPVMCQHCNHAPCETVCPVAATTHSEEGLNQMAYNRCVGTRYCANNCPYKVRRFNWFEYTRYTKFSSVNPMQDDIGRMVLNPDVVVRSRGVMEKCSLCVQRIQAGKLVAKKKGKKVEDGSIQTACSNACPTNAITFGDLNDTESTVRKEFNDDRAYFLIEEVGTQPNISYMTKVRNA